MAERPVRALRFAGFGLGVWRWPLLNILLTLRETTRLRPIGHGSLSPTMANVETWEWIDSKGRKRQLTVHREVRE